MKYVFLLLPKLTKIIDKLYVKIEGWSLATLNFPDIRY